MDKHIISRAFSKQAPSYNRYALLQRDSSKKLSTFLQENLAGQSILEIGSGSGFLTEHLIRRGASISTCDIAQGMNRFLRTKLLAQFPDISIPILTGDAEHLPFISDRFNMVASSLCFQWVDELMNVFSEVMRVLVPGGCFLFSIFGDKTLHELRSSFRQAVVFLHRTDHTQEFPTITDICQKLSEAEYINPTWKHQVLNEKYHNLKSLLRNLKMIGAINASPKRHRGLGYRRLLEETEAFYLRSYSRKGRIHATYDIYYVRAYKPPIIK